MFLLYTFVWFINKPPLKRGRVGCHFLMRHKEVDALLLLCGVLFIACFRLGLWIFVCFFCLWVRFLFFLLMCYFLYLMVCAVIYDKLIHLMLLLYYWVILFAFLNCTLSKLACKQQHQIRNAELLHIAEEFNLRNEHIVWQFFLKIIFISSPFLLLLIRIKILIFKITLPIFITFLKPLDECSH